MTMNSFIQKRAENIETLEKKGHLAWWNLATTGEETYAGEWEKSKIALRQLFTSPEDLEFLVSHEDEAPPQVKRQRVLLIHQYRENQISPHFIREITALETEVEAIYTNFRPVVEGKPLSNNDLKKILVESADSEKRKEAWEASKKIGEQVQNQVMKLISLRNESALEAGFSDFYTMSLMTQEIEPKLLFSLLEEVEKLTQKTWESYKGNLDKKLAKRYGITPDQLMPWHYQDPFFQEAPKEELDLDAIYSGSDLVELSQKFFHDIGLDVVAILQRSDLFEREKKNQHAFCTCIDRKSDVRVLCNLRPNEYWMGTLLHELGHAVYDQYIDQELPFLLRTPAHTSTTEAIAMLFGRFSKERHFLQTYAKVSKERAEEIEKAARKQNGANLLVFARWALVMIHFEKAMYQQKGIDLNAYWWDLVEKYQGVKCPKGRNAPDWASKLHLACAPAYYQNYLIGEMTASQLLHNLNKHVKGSIVGTPEAGSWLKERIFSKGALLPWDKRVTEATGEPLNPKYFSEDVALAIVPE